MSKLLPTFVWVHKLFGFTSTDIIENNEIAPFIEFNLWK